MITRRVALVDPEGVGVGLTVFVGIEAGAHTPEWLERFSAGVTAMPEVTALYRMAGDIDYLLQVAVADMAEFDAFYKRLIDVAPMKNVSSRFTMERIKHTTAYPLHSGSFREPPRPRRRRGRIIFRFAMDKKMILPFLII